MTSTTLPAGSIVVLGTVIDLPVSTTLTGVARDDALRIEASADDAAARGDFALADSAERLVRACYA